MAADDDRDDDPLRGHHDDGDDDDDPVRDPLSRSPCRAGRPSLDEDSLAVLNPPGIAPDSAAPFQLFYDTIIPSTIRESDRARPDQCLFPHPNPAVRAR